MAPEIIRNKEYNSKSDIWSLGVIIYELFRKKHPYYTESKKILWDKIKKGIIINYSGINNEIVKIIDKMLIEDPIKRIDWDDLFKYNSLIKDLYIEHCNNDDNSEDLIFEIDDIDGLDYNKTVTQSVIIPKSKPNMIAYSIDYREFNKSSLNETEDYTIFSRSTPYI